MSQLIPSVFIFYGILSLAYAGVLFQVIPKSKNNNVTYWASGALLTGSATILTVFRNESNLLLTYIGANAIAFMGYLCFNYALQSMLGIAASIKKNILISCALFVGYCFGLHFIGVYWGPKYQTVFVSTLVSMTCLYAGHLAYKIYKKNHINHAAVLCATALINCVLWGARVLLSLTDVATSAFSLNYLNSIVFICIFLFGMFWYFIFIALLYAEAHEAEQNSLGRFEEMARTLPCALYEFQLHLDRASEFKYISPNIKELLGYSAEAIMKDASLFMDRVHPDDKQRFMEVNLESYETGKIFFIEIRMIVLDGTVKWMQFSSSPQGEDFKNVAWSGYLIDVTARIEFEEKANKVEAVKKENEAISLHLREKEILIASLLKANRTSVTGALSAAIAHELNQPLGASLINIQFLKWKLNRNELTPESGADTLAYLEGDNKRAADIIKSLRSIFLDAEISSQRCDMNELIQNMLVIVRPELKKSNIELNLVLCDIKDIDVNPVEVQQVILNLINNAIQALNKSETAQKIITLLSTHHEDVFRLSIADNGVGVPEHRQNNLFQLLSSDKQAGMGLGLWLCQHIVTRHGGKLWHEINQGGGANFVMELPARL